MVSAVARARIGFHAAFVRAKKFRPYEYPYLTDTSRS